MKLFEARWPGWASPTWRASRTLAVSAVLVAHALAACSSDDTVNPTGVRFDAAVAFSNLTFRRPLDLQDPGDGSNRLFVVEQRGTILVFENSDSAGTASVFLDISSIVTFGREQGLLGLAFHPQFASNGYYFVYYSTTGQLRTRLSRFQADAGNPDTTAAGSQVDVLDIDQPFANHNGGQISFGPDGFLYIAVGDGGSGNDPQNNGQTRTTLLGKILRIDVDTLPYGIPADNPFVGNNQGYREEIFAWGLRNPWRFSFDPPTQRLWVGDVGQNAREEIDLVEKGKNYGWNIMEGSICLPPTSGCDMTGLVPPVWEYSHPVMEGRSVTGGFVYRGSALPELVGAYVYADFQTGEIWALRYDGARVTANTLLQDTDRLISSFGIDAAGELYFCALVDGRIYELVRTVLNN
ncbi:MAG: PQQ-dependent sugar dehydrogenase [Candidatus Krumholzibacteria bacterium]